jgi:hypothetical protein
MGRLAAGPTAAACLRSSRQFDHTFGGGQGNRHPMDADFRTPIPAYRRFVREWQWLDLIHIGTDNRRAGR